MGSEVFGQRTTDVPAARAERQQAANQQVDRDSRIGSLELRDAGLAGPEAGCEFDLRHAELETARAHGAAQREAHFDQRGFLGRQAEKFRGVAYFPAPDLESAGNACAQRVTCSRRR